MGEVYRARDGKLGRDVAIKVLPDEFVENEERLARFKREAKILASLNHPGIAAIHGLEESEGTHYLILELVPGETLAERISRGPIPVEEAIEIASKIAEALDRSIRTAVHFTVVDEADVTALDAKRHEYAAVIGAKLSFLPFVVIAVCRALKDHPSLNANVDDQKQEILVKSVTNLGASCVLPPASHHCCTPGAARMPAARFISASQSSRSNNPDLYK